MKEFIESQKNCKLKMKVTNLKARQTDIVAIEVLYAIKRNAIGSMECCMQINEGQKMKKV